MSGVKHTPGPWSAFYKPKYDEWHVSLPITGSGMKLALAPDGIQSENREADAHLIAAAPDLLKALIGMDEALCSGFDTQANRIAGRKALIAARAAISKATGEA